MGLKYNLIILDSAKEDFTNIKKFQSLYCNTNTRIRFTRELRNKMEMLKDSPRYGLILFTRRGIDYRKLSIDRYILIYYIELNDVYIYRIFHQAQNYHKYLGIKL